MLFKTKLVLASFSVFLLGGVLLSGCGQVAILSSSPKTVRSNQDSLQAELAAIQKELTAKQAAADQLASAKKKLETKLAFARIRIEELQESQRQATAKATEARGKLEKDFAAELTVRKKAALQTESDQNKLQAQLGSSLKQREALQTTLVYADDSRKKQAGEFAKFLQKVEAQRQETARVEAMTPKTMAELAAANQQIAPQYKTISDLEQTNRSLEEQLVAVNSEIAAFETALKTAPVIAPEVQVANVELVQKHTKAKLKVVKGIRPQPVARVEKLPEPATPVAAAPDFSAAAAFVRSWTESWEQKNVEAYLAHYSNEFQIPGSMSMSAWQKQRRQRIGKPAYIKIDIENINQQATGASSLRVTFTQKYQSDTYSDQVVKTLDMQWTRGGWMIVKETSKAL